MPAPFFSVELPTAMRDRRSHTGGVRVIVCRARQRPRQFSAESGGKRLDQFVGAVARPRVV